MAKKTTNGKDSKKFGKLLGEFKEKGETIKMYEDGNQIYQVKNGKILKNRTIHIDDIEMLLGTLDERLDEINEKEAK